MDRIKLKKALKQEIQHYLNLPYFINSPKNPHQSLSVQVAKGNWQQIQKYSNRLAKKQNIDLSQLSQQKLYNFQKKHKIGIDCSGLVYHLSDFLHKQIYQLSIRPKLIGTGGKTGPRRLSANLLTSPPNAISITNKQIQIGDLIRAQNGHHVLLIIEKTPKAIKVVDSSRKNRGVKISLIPLPLDSQLSLHRLKPFISLPPTPHT